MVRFFKKNKILSIILISVFFWVIAAQDISHAQKPDDLNLERTAEQQAADAARLAENQKKAADAAAAAASKIVKMECPVGSAPVYDQGLFGKYKVEFNLSSIATIGLPAGIFWNPPLNVTINEDPKSCTRPAASKDDCVLKAGEQPYLTSQNPDVWICYVAPSKIVRAGDIANTAITQGVRPYRMQVPIPCDPLVAGGQCPNIESGPTLANYITRLYQFGLMIVGLFAFGGIVYGAFKYILSAGSMADQSDARDQITQAVVGLVLLLGAYTILYTINPRLVSLKDPELVPLKVSDLTAPIEDTGETRQISGSQTGSVDPLCKYNVNVGIDVRFNSSLGTIGGPQSGSTCLSCRDNASKDSSGICGCNAGYQLENNACVSEKQRIDACNNTPGFRWVNGECSDH